MKKIDKIYAVVIAIFLLSMVSSQIFGDSQDEINILHSDTRQTLFTYIYTINGDMYENTTEGVQDAIESVNVSEGNCTIHFPNVNITITEALYFAPNVSYFGQSTTFYLADNVDDHMIYIDDGHNIEITGFRFDLNNKSNDDALAGVGGGSSQYRNLSVIFMRDFSSFINIHHNEFYDGHGSYISSLATEPASNVTVAYNEFYEKEHRWWSGAIDFAGSDCKALYNYIENTWATGIRSHGQTSYPNYPERNLIQGNTIRGRIGHAIHIELSLNCTATENIIYELNCSAYNGYDATLAYSSGIVVGEGCFDCIISENQIDGWNWYGIAVTENATITTNVIKNGINIDSAGGIRVKNNTIVSGNIFRNNLGPCIDVAFNNNVIVGNEFYDSTRGIVLTDAWGNVISGNSFTHFSFYAIENVRSITSIIGNTFTDSTASVIYSSGGGMIHDNIIHEITATYTIHIVQTSANLIHVSICNNEITNVSSVAIYVVCSTAGYNIPQGTISLNTINNTGGDAIQVSNIENFTMIGNALVDSSFGNDGIDLKGDVYNTMVIANDIYGYGDPIIETAPCDGNWILFNHVEYNTNSITIVGTNSRVNCTGLDDWNFDL